MAIVLRSIWLSSQFESLGSLTALHFYISELVALRLWNRNDSRLLLLYYNKKVLGCFIILERTS